MPSWPAIIPQSAGAELIERMPQAAARDLMEWPFEPTAEPEMNHVLQQEIPITEMMAADPSAVAMQDDHPANEYVLPCKLKASRFQAGSLLASWYEHAKHP